MEYYKKLEKHYERIVKLSNLLEILHWDVEVNLPKGSAPSRAEEIAELQLVVHELSTDPRLPKWLEKAKSEELGDWEKANLREMERGYRHAMAVPRELIRKLTEAAHRCFMCWQEARPRDDFQSLAPHLEEVVKVVRDYAQAKGDALGLSPYDALLDQYEPGMKSEVIDRLFHELETVLPSLIQEAMEVQQSLPSPKPQDQPIPKAKQKALVLQVAKAIGFDFNKGRVDESAHPFCGGSGEDVRITSRYHEEDFLSGVMSAIHEVGHALYELGRPKKWKWQPVGMARSLGLHESQSLLMEMQVAHSREFFLFFAPLVRQVFQVSGDVWQAENLHALATKVQPSLIRVDADEVTYPAHVILRYRLEKALLSGELSVRDLPLAWNQEMDRLLGVVPPNDRDGCMQDVHWMSGTFGYFPTYTLGAMNAAQIFSALKKDIPTVLEEVKKGNFAPLVEWLRENIHSKGCLYPSDELLEKATGTPPSSQFFKDHLYHRYIEEKKAKI